MGLTEPFKVALVAVMPVAADVVAMGNWDAQAEVVKVASEPEAVPAAFVAVIVKWYVVLQVRLWSVSFSTMAELPEPRLKVPLSLP